DLARLQTGEILLAFGLRENLFVFAGAPGVIIRKVAGGFHHRLGKPPALPEDSQSSTSSGMVQVALSNGNPIPLTLTLSHGEKEQSAAISIVREVRRADRARWVVLKGSG